MPLTVITYHRQMEKCSMKDKWIQILIRLEKERDDDTYEKFMTLVRLTGSAPKAFRVIMKRFMVNEQMGRSTGPDNNG